MEFYPTKTPQWRFKDIVSIPNGMEFYETKIENLQSANVVSIPNGMEFYFAAGVR